MSVLKKISAGTLISAAAILAFLMLSGAGGLEAFLLYETLPAYGRPEIARSLRFIADENAYAMNGEPGDSAVAAFGNDDRLPPSPAEYIIYSNGIAVPPSASDENNGVRGIEVTNVTARNIIRTSDVYYQDDEKTLMVRESMATANLSEETIANLKNLEYLRKNYYVVDTDKSGSPLTGMTAEDFDIERFLGYNYKLADNAGGPQVLIFHTHGREGYEGKEIGGILDVGERLCEVLSESYGINAIHVTTLFDETDGKSAIPGAYERMEAEISKIIARYPSIEVAIDIHRDGIDGGYRLVDYIDGEAAAQIMFVNGVSRLYKNQVLTPIEGLENPNVTANLGFSFNMELAANELYPGLARKLYIKPYRYSTHMLPKSLLIEVGAQNNTLQEALASVKYIAEILAAVIKS